MLRPAGAASGLSLSQKRALELPQAGANARERARAGRGRDAGGGAGARERGRAGRAQNCAPRLPRGAREEEGAIPPRARSARSAGEGGACRCRCYCCGCAFVRSRRRAPRAGGGRCRPARAHAMGGGRRGWNRRAHLLRPRALRARPPCSRGVHVCMRCGGAGCNGQKLSSNTKTIILLLLYCVIVCYCVIVILLFFTM